LRSLNTIETVNSIALINGCADICDICGHLGDMLRYSLQHEPEDTTLGQELEHIRNYLAIMRFRSNNFDYCLNIAPELLGLRVQRLILQPIVENCIRHGFVMPTRRGMISVEGEAKGDRLYLRVQDNGVGIPPEELAAIRDSLRIQRRPDARERIGLSNVHWRIRLRYGADYGVTVESEPGQGSRVCIALPLAV